MSVQEPVHHPFHRFLHIVHIQGSLVAQHEDAEIEILSHQGQILNGFDIGIIHGPLENIPENDHF